MDLNNYITTNPKNPSFNGLTAGKFEPGVYIDQIQFKIVHGIDVNNQAIPKWFKAPIRDRPLISSTPLVKVRNSA